MLHLLASVQLWSWSTKLSASGSANGLEWKVKGFFQFGFSAADHVGKAGLQIYDWNQSWKLGHLRRKLFLFIVAQSSTLSQRNLWAKETSAESPSFGCEGEIPQAGFTLCFLMIRSRNRQLWSMLQSDWEGTFCPSKRWRCSLRYKNSEIWDKKIGCLESGNQNSVTLRTKGATIFCHNKLKEYLPTHILPFYVFQFFLCLFFVPFFCPVVLTVSLKNLLMCLTVTEVSKMINSN